MSKYLKPFIPLYKKPTFVGRDYIYDPAMYSPSILEDPEHPIHEGKVGVGLFATGFLGFLFMVGNPFGLGVMIALMAIGAGYFIHSAYYAKQYSLELNDEILSHDINLQKIEKNRFNEYQNTLRAAFGKIETYNKKHKITQKPYYQIKKFRDTLAVVNKDQKPPTPKQKMTEYVKGLLTEFTAVTSKMTGFFKQGNTSNQETDFNPNNKSLKFSKK